MLFEDSQVLDSLTYTCAHTRRSHTLPSRVSSHRPVSSELPAMKTSVNTSCLLLLYCAYRWTTCS